MNKETCRETTKRFCKTLDLSYKSLAECQENVFSFLKMKSYWDYDKEFKTV